jgi:hypothetical protein
VKVLTPTLACYFLAVLPIIHLAFSGNKFVYDFGATFYFALVLILVLSFKKISIRQLGFKNTNIEKSLLIGSLFGLLPIIIVFLLDNLLVKTGMAQTELLAGAELRIPEEMGFHSTPLRNIFSTIIILFIDQVFIVGLIVNNMFKKENMGRVVISGGLLYSLLHFKLSLGNLFLGMISVGLLKGTGSIIPSILVHTGFTIAKIVIVFYLPRLISILVFLI